MPPFGSGRRLDAPCADRVRLKNPTVVDIITCYCRLSSCKTGVYNVSTREGVAVCIERKKKI